MRKKQALLDEGCASAVTELRLILSYSDKFPDKKSASRTSISGCFSCFDVSDVT